MGRPQKERYRDMRKHVLIVLALGALVAVSAVGIATAAGGEGPVTVKVGNLEVTADGGFTPTALSKTKQTPISLKAAGEVKEADGSHPPAVRELPIEGDKNTEVHVKGIPTSKSGHPQATDTQGAEAAGKSALIGKGKVPAQVAFAEQKPIDVPTVLQLYNGGEKGGKITWYPHAYFSDPLSGASVTTITITKEHKGRFGTLAVAKIPQITGGSGSTISFNLSIVKMLKGVNPI